MGKIQVTHRTTAAGEPLLFRHGVLEARWGPGAELSLTATATEQTRVAGGPLIELAPLSRSARPRLYAPTRERDQSPNAPPTRDSDAHGPGLRLERRFVVADLPLAIIAALRVYDDHDFIRLDMRIEHTGHDDPGSDSCESITVARVFPFVTGAWWESGSLALGGRAQEFAAYKHGWQSWSYAGGLPPGKPDPRPRDPTLVAWHSPGGRRPRAPARGAADAVDVVDVISDGVALLGHAELPVALLAGFLSANEWVGQVYLDRRAGALAAGVLLDGKTLAPGESLALPPLILALGSAPAMLAMYAGAVGRDLHARPRSQTPSGWCTWYYYFTRVAESDVVENLAAVQLARAALPLEVIQIDDGYQTAVGDWTSVNERFPSGMAALARRIRDAGYRPGLWLAPFTAAADSQLARDHPEWFVADERGRPAWAGYNWNAPLHALDTSHSGAKDWLRRLFATIVEEWGYDYLKLDFLACAAIQGRRHDPTITRARALRDGLALIRSTVGEDVFLLGCGCPLLAGVGLMDGLRIGPDSAPYWEPRHRGRPAPLSDGHQMPAMVGALRNTLTRAWLDPALWHNDPDCLLVRADDSELTLDEVRAFATAVGLTGGMVLLSDRMTDLVLDRLALAAKLLPPLDVRAQPLDLFAWGTPERIVAPVTRPWGSWTLVGLFNPQRRARELELTWRELGLAPGAYHVVEFWSGAYLGAREAGVRVRTGPHGAAALRLTPVAAEPRLIGDTFHIGQGAADVTDWRLDASGRGVHWHARLGRDAAGAFILALPHGWQVERLVSTARSASWQWGPRGELVVGAHIHDEAAFSLELRGEPA